MASQQQVLDCFTWEQVAAQVPSDVFTGWAAQEPALDNLQSGTTEQPLPRNVSMLAAVRGLFELRDPVARDRQDEVLGALVRLGSDRSGDESAALVAAAVMMPAAGALVRVLRWQGRDAGVVPVALWLAIRTHRYGPSCRMAASLRWQMRREANRLLATDGWGAEVVCVGLGQQVEQACPSSTCRCVPSRPGPVEAGARELWDLVAAASAGGGLTAEQVDLLVDTVEVEVAADGGVACGRVRPEAVVQAVADRRGWGYRYTRVRIRAAVNDLARAAARLQVA